MDAQNDISNWISSIPKITRWWFFSFFVVPLTTRLGLLDAMTLVLLPDMIFTRFQVWRIVTSLLWYPVNFRWLMMLYFLYSYSTRLETGYFNGMEADYVFMLLFNAIVLNIAGIFLGLYVLSTSLVFSVLYVWCQINKDTIVTFWFGVQVKAMYFPWVLFFFFFILGDNWVGLLVGVVVGHLYFFTAIRYPQEFGGRRLISTPQFLYRWFPSAMRRGGFGSPAADPRRDQRAGHNWGQGNRLDD